MSLYCSISATIIPRSSMLLLGQTSRYNNNDAFTLTHVSEQPQPLVRGSCSISLSLPYNNFSRSHIAFLSKFDQTCSSSVMEEEEDHKKLSLFSKEEYFKELDVAVRAVQMASSLCQRVQDTLISNTNHQVESKDDNSPVTVADWSVQAVVSWILSDCLGTENISIVAEEDVQTLSKDNSSELLQSVVKTVNECLAEAPRFGIQKPKSSLGTSEVLDIISRCNSTGGPFGRFWVLDPVDGTLGFVRGDQYAVALALVENGEVVLGVLGCPNYPMRKEWLSYQHRYHRIVSKLTPPSSESWNKGCVLYAKKGSGKAWMQPLLHVNKMFVWPNHAKQVFVSSIDHPALATFCEPVEKANSSHSFTAGLAHSVGLRKQPLRVYSMVKYAAIARGDAEVFMKFARAGYKEKIWDHASNFLFLSISCFLSPNNYRLTTRQKRERERERERRYYCNCKVLELETVKSLSLSSLCVGIGETALHFHTFCWLM